jgi:hypothetical protein
VKNVRLILSAHILENFEKINLNVNFSGRAVKVALITQTVSRGNKYQTSKYNLSRPQERLKAQKRGTPFIQEQFRVFEGTVK